MKKTYLLFSFLIFSIYTSYAQGWEKVYENIYLHDNSNWQINDQKAEATADGGFVVTGYTGNGTNTYQTVVVKTKANGDIEWSKAIAATGTMSVFAECVYDVGDGILIGGTQYSPQQSFLCKLDYYGNIQWTRSYTQLMYIQRIEKTTSGYVLVGNPYSNGIIVAKVDFSGNLKWARSYDGAYVTPSAFVATNDQGFLLVGKQTSYTYGLRDVCWAIRIDSAGAVLWSKTYGYSVSFAICSAIQQSNGNFLLFGSVIMSLNGNGDLLWVKNWLANNIRDVRMETDGSFMVLANNGFSSTGILLYHLKPDASPHWVKCFGTDKDQPGNLVKTSDKGVLICGYQQNDPANLHGLYLIKTDSLGNSGCNTDKPDIYPNAENQVPCAINSVSTGVTINPGTSTPLLSSSDFTVSVKDACCYARAKIRFDDYIACKGTPYRCSVSGGPSAHWYNGDTTHSIITSDTLVIASVSNTCGTYFDTLVIHNSPTPSISYVLSKSSLCGKDSAQVSLSTNAPSCGCYGPGVKWLGNNHYMLKPAVSSVYTVYASNAVYAPGCSTQKTFTITVSPGKPKITAHGDTLVSDSPINNQWYVNGNPLPGEISQTLIMQNPGTYAVRVSQGACSQMSNDYVNVDVSAYKINAWQKTLVSPRYGSGNAILNTPDSGFVISCAFEPSDIGLMKTDKDGNLQWNKLISGSSGDIVRSMTATNNGYLLAGSTMSSGCGNQDALVVATDMSGNILWSKTYGTWNNEEYDKIIKSSGGDFYALGGLTNPTTYTVDGGGWFVGATDMMLVKLNNSGNIIWSKKFDLGYVDRAFDIAETSSGQLVVASCIEQVPYQSSARLMMLDANGNAVWQKALPSSGGWMRGVTVTADNKILINGGNYPSNTVTAFDLSGNFLWSRGLGNRQIGKVIATRDSGIVIGTTSIIDSARMIKLNSQGQLLWSNDLSHVNYVTDIIETPDGSLAMTGGGDTCGLFIYNYISLIKTDAQGKLNCNSAWPTSVSSITYTTTDISVAPTALSLTVTPGQFSVSSLHMNAIEYCRKAEAGTTSRQELKNAFYFELFPNPSHDVFYLSGSFTEAASLRVLDITGRSVLQKNVLGHDRIDLSGKEPGVYMAEVKVGDKIIVKKIILQ